MSESGSVDSGVQVWGVERHIWAWIIGGICSFSAVIASSVHIYRHHQVVKANQALNKADKPRRHVIKILFMVPIYGLAAWLGLYLKQYTMYWDVVREFYESFTIFSFFMFLKGYLGGSDALVQRLREIGLEKEAEAQKNKQDIQARIDFLRAKVLEAETEEERITWSKKFAVEEADMQEQEKKLLTAKEQEHMWPFGYCFSRWSYGEVFYFRTRYGVLQYVVVRGCLAATTFILEYVDLYGDGEFHGNRGFGYIAFCNNASQIWAMYCLVLFYMVMAEDLKDIKPMYKFVCIKAVVFFTFWQQVVIAGCVRIGVIRATQTYTVEKAAAGLQDFCICIEMLFAAIAHYYAFPVDEDYTPVASKAPIIRPHHPSISPFPTVTVHVAAPASVEMNDNGGPYHEAPSKPDLPEVPDTAAKKN